METEEIINTRFVLFEKISLYPLCNIEKVRNEWFKGRHPNSCQGNCNIVSYAYGFECLNCGFNDNCDEGHYSE
jgi:hypothetical protein